MLKGILVFFMIWAALSFMLSVYNILNWGERLTVVKVLFRSGLVAAVAVGILSLIVVLF